ncbi:MAG: hypothetical protein PVH62_04995 [Anaerolineae bacterium]|jgi:hypothetical protein
MITKRQLGIFLAAVGIAVSGGIMIVDRIGAGAWGGFGPLQRIGLGLGVAVLIIGLVLIRVGDRPA